jgi:CubicO group peptidase (beta-lactamase class C family)
VRELLTHTSSILDPDVDLYRPGDTQISLERYLRGTLVPGGEYYAASNWASWSPGAKYEYSNTGVTLLGYLVELNGGSSFALHCERHIFEPLGMTETAWRLADLDDTSHVAMPYEGRPGRYAEEGLYGYPDFPAGMLRTSVRQLATFLRMFMNGGELDGVRILRPETVAEMMKVQVPANGDAPDQGLVWFYEDFGPRRVFLHDGSDPGVFTIMGFDPKAKVGAIVLTNGGAERDGAAEDAVFALFERLLTEAENL